MKIFLLLVLCLLPGQTPAFLFAGDNIVSTVIDKGVSAVHSVVDQGIQLGGKIIGAVFHPYEVWKPDMDTDHGHSEGKVTKCPAIADVIFVMDASGSIGSKDFYKELDFAIRLTEHFKIGRNDVRFGLVVFSDTAKKMFDLEDYSDHRSIAQAIKATPYMSKGTKTYHGLELVRSAGMFRGAAGGRNNANKIVIILTDGLSDRIFKTINKANDLKREGVEIIAVGIGSGLGIELSGMASGSGNVYKASNIDDLYNIEQKVARRTCEIPQEAGNVPAEEEDSNRCRDNPCEHICRGYTTGFVCSCKPGFEATPSDSTKCQDINECSGDFDPPVCEHVCHNTKGGYRCSCDDGYVISANNPAKCDVVTKCHVLADIILLIDSSGSIGYPNYQRQLDFLARLTGHFQIGPNDVRIASVIYSDDAQIQFNLKSYSDSQSLSQALKGAPYLTGSTFTNEAMDHIDQNNMFASSSGGRDSAVKIALVVTDGKSSRPDLTSGAAARLKNKGVKLLSVGIGDNVSDQELLDMASGPDDVFKSDSFESLDYIEQRVADRACRN